MADGMVALVNVCVCEKGLKHDFVLQQQNLLNLIWGQLEVMNVSKIWGNPPELVSRDE